MMTVERRKKLIRLAVVAILIDLVTTLFELPFMAFTLGTITLEEILEQIVSTLIARNDLKLTLIDRLVGMLPVPGITPVTVCIAREFFLKK
jgi:hypothetical protein